MNTAIKRSVIHLKPKILWKFFKNTLLLIGIIFLSIENINGQNLENTNDESCNNKISDFQSLFLNKISKGETLQLPPTHTFQKIIQKREIEGPSEFSFNFAGYVPKEEDITKGYLCINNGTVVQNTGGKGGVAILDIKYNATDKLWDTTGLEYLDFSDTAGGLSKNNSGVVTPWGTIISGEEHYIYAPSFDHDLLNDGHYKYGWQVEINPKTKTMKKLYGMGRFTHENAAIHANKRTVYHIDEGGYLYKFIAETAEDLSSGDLFVYKADGEPVPKNTIKCEGTGKWLKIENKIPGVAHLGLVEEGTSIRIKDIITTDNYTKGSNNVDKQRYNLGATSFTNIENIEMGFDGKIYFAARKENVIYYFDDTDPLGLNPNQSVVDFLGVYVAGYADGNNFQLETSCETVYNVPWKGKPDVLEFDNEGNLFIGQSNTNHNSIWMVEKGHTIDNPKIKLMTVLPKNFEPNGFTFTPDNRFMFLSLAFQAENAPIINNTEPQIDASGGNPIVFNEAMTIVIARKEHLGFYTPTANLCDDGNPETTNDVYNEDCICEGQPCTKNQIISANNTTGQSAQSLYVSSQAIQTEVTKSDDIDVIVRSNETVDLKSDHIKLNEGFKVESGGCLNAVIEPCQ